MIGQYAVHKACSHRRIEWIFRSFYHGLNFSPHKTRRIKHVISKESFEAVEKYISR